MRVGPGSWYYNNIFKDGFDIYKPIKKASIDKRNKCQKRDELYFRSQNTVISPKSVTNYFKE